MIIQLRTDPSKLLCESVHTAEDASQRVVYEAQFRIWVFTVGPWHISDLNEGYDLCAIYCIRLTLQVLIRRDYRQSGWFFFRKDDVVACPIALDVHLLGWHLNSSSCDLDSKK